MLNGWTFARVNFLLLLDFQVHMIIDMRRIATANRMEMDGGSQTKDKRFRLVLGGSRGLWKYTCDPFSLINCPHC